MLQRAWLLGPRHIGPNLLLATDGTSSTLFSVPGTQVVVTAKQHPGASGSDPAGQDLGAAFGHQRVRAFHGACKKLYCSVSGCGLLRCVAEQRLRRAERA